MGEATREFAIAKTIEILRAYVRKIEDARGYLDCLSPEGRQIVEDYDKDADGQKTLLLKASGSEDFFSGMPDEAVLAYADVCRKMNERFELNVKEVYPIERLAADKKGFWETLWGALQGEFNEDPSGSEILIDMGLNFIPFVGKACDARDIAACLKKLVIERRADEISVWVTLLLTAVGCIPVAGDVVKAGCKAILKGADDIFLTVLKKIDADDAYGAFVKFRSKFASGIDKAVEMVCKWIEEARKSKYGSKVDSVLASAGENLRKAEAFVTEQIGEFGERVFKTGKVSTVSNNVQKSLVEQTKKDMTILKNEKHPHNYMRHGNFGEMAVDVDLEGTGHIKRISLSRVESLNAPMHHGIDGIYENLTPPPKYIILDSKYLSSEASKADTFAPTMSTSQKTKITQLDDSWIRNNLEAQFKDSNGVISPENLKKITEIRKAIKSNDEKMCLRLGAKIDNTGKITYYKYDTNGKVLKTDAEINGKSKQVPMIWNKE